MKALTVAAWASVSWSAMPRPEDGEVSCGGRTIRGAR